LFSRRSRLSTNNLLALDQHPGQDPDHSDDGQGGFVLIHSNLPPVSADTHDHAGRRANHNDAARVHTADVGSPAGA